MTEEPQKQLAGKMIAFLTRMKKFEEEVAQPDKALLDPQSWNQIDIPADKAAAFIEAYAHFEKLSPREQKSNIEFIGDGLDEAFFDDETDRPKQAQAEFVKQQALFLINALVTIMKQGLTEEILSAPVDVEGIQSLAKIAAEEREDRAARKSAKTGLPPRKNSAGSNA